MNKIKITDVRANPGDSAFLLDDGKTSILYDTGFGFTGFEVARKVKQSLGNRKLDYIFLSHSHYDHVLGSAYALRYWNDATVVAGKYAAEIFKRSGAKAVMKDLDMKYAKRCGVGEYEFLGDELRVDIAAEDGDIIRAGDMSFEILNLPGHTKCSIGFYLREQALFLSPETIGVYDGDKLIMPSFLVSYKSTLDSIDRVLKLNIDRILIPHFGILNKRQTDYFLANCRKSSEDLAHFILERLENGSTDSEIITGFKERYWHGYIKEISPEDAVELNTSIMVELVRKELLQDSCDTHNACVSVV